MRVGAPESVHSGSSVVAREALGFHGRELPLPPHPGSAGRMDTPGGLPPGWHRISCWYPQSLVYKRIWENYTFDMRQGGRLRPAKHILLTGAGFSQNFGGYLASEMWSAIRQQPEVQADPQVQQAMANNTYYESVYDEVMFLQERFSDSQRQAFLSAVTSAYHQLHRVLCEDYLADAARTCQAIISRFGGRNSEERGFLFTLNQDLLIEHYYGGVPFLKIPSLEEESWFRGGYTAPVHTTDYILPSESQLQPHKDEVWRRGPVRSLYLKLHGSFQWRAADGSGAMVIGRHKTRMIEKEPLLRWFFELFKQVLNFGDRSLIVTGYGFGEQHINEVILDALKHHGLQLVVLNPTPTEEFKSMMIAVQGVNISRPPLGPELWEKMDYRVGSIKDCLTPNSLDLTTKGRIFFENLNLRRWNQ